MATAASGVIKRESGQDAGSGELTAGSDAKNYTSGEELWSKKSGYAPTVLPNGVISGFTMTPHASNDTVAYSAGVTNLNGVADTATAAGSQALATARTGSGDAYRIDSLTQVAAGTLIFVTGTAHASALDPTGTRGDAGAPPVIPVDSIELGQVLMTSNVAAVFTATEIKQVPNTNKEMANYPSYEVQYMRVAAGIIGEAGVEFSSSLPLIHTAGVPKKCYATWHTPEFADITEARNFKPALNSQSSSSEQFYGNKTRTSQSISLGDGSFEVGLPEGGITDPVLDVAGEILWYKMFQDSLATEYMLTLGIVEFDYTENVDSYIVASATLSSVFGKTERVKG